MECFARVGSLAQSHLATHRSAGLRYQEGRAHGPIDRCRAHWNLCKCCPRFRDRVQAPLGIEGAFHERLIGTRDPDSITRLTQFHLLSEAPFVHDMGEWARRNFHLGMTSHNYGMGRSHTPTGLNVCVRTRRAVPDECVGNVKKIAFRVAHLTFVERRLSELVPEFDVRPFRAAQSKVLKPCAIWRCPPAAMSRCLEATSCE